MTRRPVEALRIALGLASGSHTTTVILLGDAIRLLGDEIEDILDGEFLEQYLPTIEKLEIPFILQDTPDRIPVRNEFSIRRGSDEIIRSSIQSMDCALVF